MSGTTAVKEEREECEEEIEEDSEEKPWEIWTDTLEELVEIVDAFEVDKLQGKTILDVGTDGVKPLYIALKLDEARRNTHIEKTKNVAYTRLKKRRFSSVSSNISESMKCFVLMRQKREEGNLN